MPINVACRCGQRLSAKDELAGKTVKCPKCGQPVTVPKGMEIAKNRAEGVGSLLDDAGLKAGIERCPGCGTELPAEAILCVMCGFDLRRGHRLKTHIGTVSDIDDEGLGELPYHGVPELDDAERSIARDKREQEKLKKGVPWWMLLLAFLGLVGFVVGMVSMPQNRVMYTSGMVLQVAGVLLSAFFVIRIWIVAFHDSTLQGLLVVFIPIYIFVYIAMHWDRCGGLFFFVVAGWMLQGAGVTLVFVGPMLQGDSSEGTQGLNYRPGGPAIVAVCHETTV